MFFLRASLACRRITCARQVVCSVGLSLFVPEACVRAVFLAKYTRSLLWRFLDDTLNGNANANLKVAFLNSGGLMGHFDSRTQVVMEVETAIRSVLRGA